MSVLTLDLSAETCDCDHSTVKRVRCNYLALSLLKLTDLHVCPLVTKSLFGRITGKSQVKSKLPNPESSKGARGTPNRHKPLFKISLVKKKKLRYV